MRTSGWLAVAVLCGACRFNFEERGAPADAAPDAAVEAGPVCTEHWCWERAPIPERRELRAIDGSSPTNVWAVGDGGVIRHWDGVAWTTVPSPTFDALTAIDVFDDSDVTIAAGAGVLWHWDGAIWTMTTLPTKSSVAALFRAQDGALWTAGDLGTITIDGATATPVPNSYAGTGLDGRSPTDVWHTGVFNSVSHWNGTSWAQVVISDFGYAVAARSSGGSFVGGSNIWTCDDTPACTQQLTGVAPRDFWLASDTAGWAVGIGGRIEQWNGSAWQTVTSPVQTDLDAVWGWTESDVWAVGANGGILHYDGTSWSVTSDASVAEPKWRGLWVGNDSDRWLGALDGTMWHSDGDALTMVALPNGSLVGDEIEGNSGTDIYALDVGNLRVMHYDGSSWQLDPSLSMLSATGGGLATTTTETLASNLTGTISRKPAGGTFSVAFNNPGTEYHGICFAPNGDAIVMGRLGSAAVRTGGTWAVNDPPTGRFMVGCSFAGDTAWAVGGDTVVQYFSGAWMNLDTMTKTRQPVQDVLAVTQSEVYVVGGAGRIVHFDGSAWAEEAGPVGFSLLRLVRSTSGTIYAAGYGPGMIRRR